MSAQTQRSTDWIEVTGLVHRMMMADAACPVALWAQMGAPRTRAWVRPLSSCCHIAYLPGDVVATFRDQVVLLRTASPLPLEDQIRQSGITVEVIGPRPPAPAPEAMEPPITSSGRLVALCALLSGALGACGLLALLVWVLRLAGAL